MAKKTHEQYENELFEREIDFWPLEEYKGARTKILHMCLNNHSWEATPDNILRGASKCPYCAGRVDKDTFRYCEKLDTKGIIYTPVEAYIDTMTPILHECPKGHRWKIRPNNILSGYGCPQCNHRGVYSKKYFEKNPDKAIAPGALYVIVLVHKQTLVKTCVKIGITQGTSNKDVLKRAANFTGYEPRIQKTLFNTLEKVYNLEQELHAQWANYRYLESHKFGGHTELFQISQLSNILKSIPSEV